LVEIKDRRIFSPAAGPSRQVIADTGAVEESEVLDVFAPFREDDAVNS
jgi:hypothetical protein